MKKIYFLLFFIALSIYICQQTTIPLPRWINHYVNDFLCIPLVLGGIVFILRKWKKDPQFSIPFPTIVVVVLLYALYFEYYLPQHNPRYTADVWDVVLYALGGLFFYYIEKSVPRKPSF